LLFRLLNLTPLGALVGLIPSQHPQNQEPLSVDPAHAWPIAVRVSSLPLHAHKAQLVTANYDGMGWSKRGGAAGWYLTLSGT